MSLEANKSIIVSGKADTEYDGPHLCQSWSGILVMTAIPY